MPVIPMAAGALGAITSGVGVAAAAGAAALPVVSKFLKGPGGDVLGSGINYLAQREGADAAADAQRYAAEQAAQQERLAREQQLKMLAPYISGGSEAFQEIERRMLGEVDPNSVQYTSGNDFTGYVNQNADLANAYRGLRPEVIRDLINRGFDLDRSGDISIDEFGRFHAQTYPGRTIPTTQTAIPGSGTRLPPAVTASQNYLSGISTPNMPGLAYDENLINELLQNFQSGGGIGGDIRDVPGSMDFNIRDVPELSDIRNIVPPELLGQLSQDLYDEFQGFGEVDYENMPGFQFLKGELQNIAGSNAASRGFSPAALAKLQERGGELANTMALDWNRFGLEQREQNLRNIMTAMGLEREFEGLGLQGDIARTGTELEAGQMGINRDLALAGLDMDLLGLGVNRDVAAAGLGLEESGQLSELIKLGQSQTGLMGDLATQNFTNQLNLYKTMLGGEQIDLDRLMELSRMGLDATGTGAGAVGSTASSIGNTIIGAGNAAAGSAAVNANAAGGLGQDIIDIFGAGTKKTTPGIYDNWMRYVS